MIQLEELKKEIEDLRRQVQRIWFFIAAAQMSVVIVIVFFTIQSTKITSYYQSTIEQNQEILLNQKHQENEIQKYLSELEKILPDRREEK